MSKIKVFILLFVLLFGSLSALAQTINKLTIDDVTSPVEKDIRVPVRLVNSDQIVAVQFDVVAPTVITRRNVAFSSNRFVDHVVVVNSLNDTVSRVMLYSPSNTPLKGNSGNLLELKMFVTSACTQGAEYPLKLRDVVLAKSSGDNCVTAFGDGKLVILDSPDLQPEWVATATERVAPGDTLRCSWRVWNVGKESTSSEGGWQEQIFVVSEATSRQVLLGSQYCNETIAPQAGVLREFEIIVPDIPGVSGPCLLTIKLTPDAKCGEPVSLTENNACLSNSKIEFDRALYISNISRSVNETNSAPIKYKLTRSGDILHSETFNVIVNDPDNRVTFPATIEIPSNCASAYFYVTIAANGVYDDRESVTFSVSGNEYPQVESTLCINDDTIPQLEAYLSKEDLVEGESFDLTIELPRAYSVEKTIYLSSNNTAKVQVPSEIVIPAGEKSVTISLTVIDNDEAELEEPITIKVAADGCESAQCEALIRDNDMPELLLSFSPAEVSESAGGSAVIATIKRLTNIDKAVKLQLLDDSKGELSLSHKTITLAKGAESGQFLIDVTDNDLVDGDKRFNITAAVYSSTCNCYANELSGGLVTAELIVLDDDGPHLSIAAGTQAFLEGSTDNKITITRNTSPDADLEVTISSDKDHLVEYNHQVVIPAGAMSAEVVVAVPGNDTSGDSDIVSFKAESDGMSAGSCWAVITDQTLPDATLQLEITPNYAAAGNCIDLILTISNEGNSVLQRNTPIDITCTGISASKRVYTRKAIEKGCSEKLVVEDFQLPERTGLVVISAVINGDENVAELLYSNNRAKNVEINLSPAFEVTTAIDKTIYLQEDEVVISGHASGEAGQNAKIEIVLINDGVRQVLSTTTDEDGNYSYSYKLLSRQTGHFSVGACYPTSTPTNFVAFDVYGLQLSSAFVTCEPGLGETVSGSFTISNPGNLSQSNLSIAYSSNTTNCEFDIEAPSTIAAGSSINVNFSMKGNSLSPGKDFEKIPLLITTAEGSKAIFTIYYYIQARHGKLHTSTPSISTTMLKDTPRDYPIVIRNIGKGESGIISFAMPSWVETATPREIPSLASGDSTTIVLRFKPTDEMKLNVLTKGKLGINCANGDGLSVSFGIMPVSEATGRVTIDVVDEFTFYTDEAPHVSNAKVVITHPTSKEVIAEGQTDNNGIFTAEMNEGWYTLTIEADHHDAYTENIIVSPGTELHKEVFMPYQAITYKWNVEETEIEDEYVFETTIDFDTRVPKPVIVISLPDEKPEPYSVIPVKITNKGLINAVNIEMSLEVSDGYTLEFLNDPTAEVLAPQQTLIFYAKLMPTESGSAIREKTPHTKSQNCFWIISIAKYHELCQKYIGDQFVQMLRLYGEEKCVEEAGKQVNNGGNGNDSSSGPSGDSGSPSGGSDSGGSGRPSVWKGNNYESGYYIIDWENPRKYCKPQEQPRMDVDDYVPEGEPEEAECDEKPEFKFMLLDVKTGDYREGVAADGVSKLRIVIDPASRVPKDECDYSYWWNIPNAAGELSESYSYKEVIYTAPADYPDNYTAKRTVNAIFYFHKPGEDVDSINVPIELVRTPVVFVHGLGSDYSCWKECAHKMVESGLYAVNQIVLANYSSTNTASFSTNYDRVGDAISSAISKMKDSKIVVNRVDLVGHSMGGILSRFHVQRNGGDDVHKLITANTPHSGSEIGDIIVAHNILMGAITKLFYHNSDIGAVYDLAVNSDAINNDLNSPAALSKNYYVPVHAISSNSIQYDEIVKNGPDVVDLIADTFAGFIPQFRILFELLGCYFEHIIADDYSQLGQGDLIVSNQSQQGGCSNISHFDDGPWHCDSPNSLLVYDKLRELLTADVSSAYFSGNWFHPAKRTFVHEDYPIEDIIFIISKYKLLKIVKNLINTSDYGNNAQGSANSLVIQFDEECADPLTIVNFGDEEFEFFRTNDIECPIPLTYQGMVKVTTFYKTPAGQIHYMQQEIEVDKSQLLLEKVSSNPITLEVSHKIEPIITCEWSNGSTTYVAPDTVVFDSDIAKYSNSNIIAVKPGKCVATLSYRGKECKVNVTIFDLPLDTGDNSDAICSTVSLSFKQSAVMTRQAFRGNFTLNNGHQTGTIREFKLNLEVKDEDGVVATRREFEITPEKLAGFQGNLDFNSGWSLEPSHNGEASILFIPTKHAAPTEPKEYSFGGTFSYLDPYTGLTVTRTLNPVTLTVNPSPQLELTYFLQRDVFGDDPLTEEVEPMKPAEFALLLNNIGAGDATSLKLTTGLPQIVSNEKGLYVNFELVRSQLNGSDQSLMLGGSAVTDFGSLKAGEQSYAQWWLQSSLLGHFVKYDVNSTHVTSYDNPDLSLVDTVTIHELIHGFDLMRDDLRRRAFIVNDIADVLDTPDQIYFTDGSQADVVIARDAFISKVNDLEYILNVSASAPGWNYGTISDPTNGRQCLSSIKRMSDGAELAIDNFWQTDRTLIDGKDPLAENLLHFIDYFSNGDASYRLTFTPKPDIELAIDSVIGLPDEDEILSEQLKTVTIKFNKPIDSSTFTIEDLGLYCQGERVDISNVTITSKTDTEYLLDLSSATLENGFYVLSIQTSSISDVEGFAGATGKQVSWIQYVDGKVKLTTMVMPVEGGSVTPSTGLYDYDSTVKLQATPSEEYQFQGWWCGDDLISENLETEVSLTEDKEYIARFTLQQFKISVECNGEGGYIEGTATGIYDFGQVIRVEAVPNYGWSFSHWTVNGSDVSSDSTNILELPVNNDTDIYATFVSHIKASTIPLYKGWNWISSVFDDKNLYNPVQFFKSIKPTLAEVQTKEGNLVLNDGNFEGSIERMIPGSYKVKVNNTTSLRLKGATVSEDSYEVKLCQGWTWLPYVPVNEQNIGEALVNLNAKENDILKSHTQFAVFSDGRWLGTLKSFVPNEGYMYYASEPASFKYPSEAISTYSTSADNESPWQYNEKGFADNKTIIANILDDGTLVSEEDYFVGAFCGEECRGIGVYVDYSLFIMVHGKQGDKITFKAINNNTGEIREIKESITFDDNPLGSVASPYNLNLGTNLSINDLLVGYGFKITPNPVKDVMYLEGNLSDVKSIRVIATSGATVISTDSFEQGINVSSIPDGVYVAVIVTSNGEVYKKFIKKGY